MAARLPDEWMHEDRGVESDHVGAEADVVSPPHALDVVLQLDAERPVVPARPRPAVDLARLEDEPAPLAERDDDVHVHRPDSPPVAVRAAVFRRALPILPESPRAATPR